MSNHSFRITDWRLGLLLILLLAIGFIVFKSYNLFNPTKRPMENLCVHPNQSYIDFNRGHNEGWTYLGLFDGETNAIVGGGSATPQPAHWSDTDDVSSAPFLNPNGDNIGSLAIGIGPCRQCQKDTWRFQLTSGDLSADPEWADIKGFRIHMLDSAALFGVAAFTARFELDVIESNGNEAHYREIDVNGTPIERKAIDQKCWNAVKTSFSLPAESQVKFIHIIVSGPSFRNNPTGHYRLGGVCII